MPESPNDQNFREIDNIPALVAALAHDDPVERNHVREALVAIGTPAVKYLVKLLSDPESHIRWEAAKALWPIGDPAAAPALVKALEDKDTDVRWLAAAASHVGADRGRGARAHEGHFHHGGVAHHGRIRI